MIAANFSTVRKNLKSFCDHASDQGEIVVVTRKGEKNVVILSLDEYNRLVKEEKRAQYLSMLDRSMEQIRSGKGKEHELIEDGK
jgi:antitoxin YefM